MSRASRLLELMQHLRRHRRPVSGSALAGELGISLRTLYRDIATLQAQGARIDGAPGLGYLLRPGDALPPLMFGTDEIEALVLGMRWVAQHGDMRLVRGAQDALAKVAAVLPAELRHLLDDTALMIGPSRPDGADHPLQPAVRQAIREQHKLAVSYRDADGRESRRTIWPIALGYFDRCQVVVAWCELRQALRHFRCDRIAAFEATGVRYPQRRQVLLQAWRAEQGITRDNAADRI